MIKGKYAGQITIDFEVDENTPGLFPADELIATIKNKTSEMIRELVADEVDNIGTVAVETLYADAYLVKDVGADD